MAETHKQVYRETVSYLHDVLVFVTCQVSEGAPKSETSWWWKDVTCTLCRRKAPKHWRKKWGMA